MDDDIDLNGIELFDEDIEGAEIDLDDVELNSNGINMERNQQDNHERSIAAPDNIEANTFIRKRGRSKLTKTRNSEVCQVEIDPTTKKPTGKYGARYSTWVGLEAKTRFSILGTDWRKFDQLDKDRMWMAIKRHWHLSDDTLKKETLSIACTAWRNFKKNLKAEYMEKNRSPCTEFNFIDEETWQKFCQKKSEPEFQALSKINRAHAKENKNPHHLGSRGYQGKYDVWDKEQEQGITPEIFGVMHKRSRHWLLARRAKGADKTYTLEEHTMAVAKEIMQKDTQFSQGDWDPKLGIDPLVAVLGPEHPGRTRGVGHNVGLRVGLGIENNKRKNKDNLNLKAEILEVRAQMQRERREFEEHAEREKREYQEQANKEKKILEDRLRQLEQKVFAKNDATIVCTSHLLTIKHATPCELLFGFKKANAIVAKGVVFPLENDIVDGVRLEAGYIKVRVELVMDGCEGFPLPVPLQNADITKLGDALGNCIQWDQQFLMLQPSATSTNKPVPPNLTSGSTPIPPLITSTKVPSKSASIPPKVHKGDETHSNRAALASESQSKTQTITKMKPLTKENCMAGLRKRLDSNHELVKNGVTAQVEVGVFGPTESHIAVKYSDLEDLMTNGWLDQSIVTWFLVHLHMVLSKNSKNRCAFIAPTTINAYEIQRDGPNTTQIILNTMMHKIAMDFFLAPYWQGNHWSLLIIRPRQLLVYVLDSMMSHAKTATTYKIKEFMDMAIKEYNKVVAPRQADIATQVTWKLVKCNQQKAGWECGYYVIRQLFNFVMREQYAFSNKDTWTTEAPFTMQQIDEMACLMAQTFTSKRMMTGKMW